MRNNTIKQTDLPDSLSRHQLPKLRACRGKRISRPSHGVRGSVALSRAMSLLVVMRCHVFAICKIRRGVSGRVARGITRGSAGGSGRVIVASTEDAAQSHAHAGSPARWRRLCGGVEESMFGATVGESRECIVVAGSHQWACRRGTVVLGRRCRLSQSERRRDMSAMVYESRWGNRELIKWARHRCLKWQRWYVGLVVVSCQWTSSSWRMEKARVVVRVRVLGRWSTEHLTTGQL